MERLAPPHPRPGRRWRLTGQRATGVAGAGAAGAAGFGLAFLPARW